MTDDAKPKISPLLGGLNLSFLAPAEGDGGGICSRRTGSIHRRNL